MIEAGFFIIDTLLDVSTMLWRSIQFLFGRTPTLIRGPD